MGAAEKNTAKSAEKRHELWEEIYSLFLLMSEQNILLKNHMQRMSKIKDIWEPEHHIITKKNAQCLQR